MTSYITEQQKFLYSHIWRKCRDIPIYLIVVITIMK